VVDNKPGWHGLHRFVEAEYAGAASKAIATAIMAAIIRNDIGCDLMKDLICILIDLNVFFRVV
jgi:hypothetical protein